MAPQSRIASLLDEAVTAVGRLSPATLERGVDLLYEAWRHDATIVSCGNGGSASTASHFAGDLAKYTIVDGQPRVRALCLNDNATAVTAWTNDDGFAEVYAEQARPWLGSSSAVVTFSVHGGLRSSAVGEVSSNLPRLCQIARLSGASIIAVTGFDGGAIGKLADLHINVPVDREPVATPLIESVHVLVHHALCAGLRERIETLPRADPR
jgi:D-sedoheptulose 7-phosphate isomerase